MMVALVVVVLPVQVGAPDRDKSPYGVRGPYQVGTTEFVIEDEERPLPVTVMSFFAKLMRNVGLILWSSFCATLCIDARWLSIRYRKAKEEKHMSEKQLTYGLIVVGIVLALASLLVDVVGVGTEGFGVGQVIGLILGIILAGVGVYRGFIR